MKLIIVGGGIAGLTAGIYARQSGIEATIFEMHSIPGGNSTSCKRKGYLFDGGMHWLVGSSSKVPLNRLWKEVGALQNNNPIYNRDPFLTYMDKSGLICLYRDPERLKNHLLDVSPQDEQAIKDLIKDIKAFEKISMPIMDIKGVRTKYKSSPPFSMLIHLPKAMAKMGKLNKITSAEYAARFKHPGIRTLLGLVVGSSGYAASSISFTLGGLAAGDAGYPKGGSLRMAQNMATTFKQLGGKIEYNKRVDLVHIKEGKADGVFVDGELHAADAVIVTADTRSAIDNLFENPLQEPWMEQMRNEVKPLNSTFISIGVQADLSKLPENMIFPLDQPFDYGGVSHNSISFNNYACFEGYAPDGCTSLTCALLEDTYDEWKEAKINGTYEQKKQELANIILDRLAQVIPQTAGKVEVWDIATPVTYERYCGTYRGSWMSIMEPGSKRQQYPSQADSISMLYFAGHRLTLPGGLPVALYTGRQAIQHLCRDLDVVFQAEVK